MTEDLPEEFDLIVFGTGFSESCVAAAASRIGKTVLHIDPNEFYGGSWASFNLIGFHDHIGSGLSDEVRNSSYKWHDTPVGTPVEGLAHEPTTDEQQWTQIRLLEQSRRFNIDLCPKILYSAGQLVQLLISSNICRYAEFRAVDRVCTRVGEEFLKVPCSRSDVFNTSDLSIVEKRLLMKFLTLCTAFRDEDLIEFRGRTFLEYLQQQKLTEKITTCIVQAIAMINTQTSLEDGMQSVQRFLNSLGRYGNTPFLFPMYGSGEIPQCFCRLCAVFGGIYCLKRRVEEININADTNSVSVMLEQKAIRAKHVVSSHANLPANLRQSNIGVSGFGPLINGLSRGVLLASTPLGNAELNSGGGGVNLLRLVANEREAILMQLSHYSGTCPKGVYLFHITTPALSDNPEQDLQPFMAQIFTGQQFTPHLIYSAYFSLTCCATTPQASPVDAATPVFCTAAPYYELDYDLSIKNAHDIFKKLYGAEVDFLPRAPDPEEIIVEGEDPRALSEANLPEDLREQLQELEQLTHSMQVEESNEKGSQQMDAE